MWMGDEPVGGLGDDDDDADGDFSCAAACLCRSGVAEVQVSTRSTHLQRRTTRTCSGGRGRARVGERRGHGARVGALGEVLGFARRTQTCAMCHNIRTTVDQWGSLLAQVPPKLAALNERVAELSRTFLDLPDERKREFAIKVY